MANDRQTAGVRITKREWAALGGLRNSDLYRVQGAGGWRYYKGGDDMTSQQEADAMLERDRARRKAEGVRALRVLAVRDRKRLRVKDMATGLFVSCPTEWRQAMPLGVPHVMAASLRADGACFVASSHDAPPVPI